MSCANCSCKECRQTRARTRLRKLRDERLYGQKCEVEIRGGRCGGTIGPDIYDEPMCYRCGPVEHLPEAERAKIDPLVLANREWRPVSW